MLTGARAFVRAMTSTRLCVVALLVSCTNTPSIIGEWQSGCYALPARHSIVSDIHATRSSVLLETRLFADSSCASQNLTLAVRASYVTGARSGEGHAIDVMPTQVTILLLRPEVVDHYNKKRACGITDWAVGESRDITASRCDPSLIPDVQAKISDIYQIEDGVLRFGSLPQPPPGGRPTKLRRDLRWVQRSAIRGDTP